MRRSILVVAAIVAAGCGETCPLAEDGPCRSEVPLCALDVTDGRLEARPDGWLTTSTPSLRAVVAGVPAAAGELAFEVEGGTVEEVPLSSGDLRRQVALKLRARDGCNVVYVAWREHGEIVVSIKENLGARFHFECGAGGYRTVSPASSRPVAPLVANGRHRLEASLVNGWLSVRADEDVAWEGALGPEPLAFDGPLGLRTDNLQVRLRLFAQRCPAPLPVVR